MSRDGKCQRGLVPVSARLDGKIEQRTTRNESKNKKKPKKAEPHERLIPKPDTDEAVELSIPFALGTQRQGNVERFRARTGKGPIE